MFLACVELADQPFHLDGERPRVLQLKFDRFETAKVWAQEESTRHRLATGNAAVFETMGPYLSLAWEHNALEADEPVEIPDFASDHLTRA